MSEQHIRAAALREAAEQLRTEARWQCELQKRGNQPPSWQWHLDRLLMIETILIGRAADVDD